MTFDQILSDLHNKIYRPVYFLMGEESYFIDEIAGYISKNVLTEGEKTFNQLILYGKDTDAANIINAAKRFPMMANYQVIIVKEAQELKKIDDLIYYVEKPLKSTILVICYKYGKLDKRKKLLKSLQGNAVLFESDKISEYKVPDWISAYLKNLKLSIDPAAAALINEFIGNDLEKIVNELNKLSLVLPPGTTKINTTHIERNIGISKDYNLYELTKALSSKNTAKAFRIINYFSHNPKSGPLIVTLGILYSFFSKVLMYHNLADKSKNNVISVLNINPYAFGEYEMAVNKYSFAKVIAIISYLREYDIKAKGGSGNVPDGELMQELIFKILH